MQFRVLGPVEVVDGGQVLDIGSPRRRALLARLLLDVGHVVPLDRLIEDLWAGEPPGAATSTLQAHISHLRRQLEPERAPRAPATTLVTRPPGYALDVDAADVDVVVFEAAIAEGRAQLAVGRPADAERRFDAALALWRGSPYADVEPDDFAQVERRRLVELRASALEDRLAAVLDQGRHRYAVGDLEVLVDQHPYRERLWELLVLARYRSGQQVDALRAYQEARRVLVEEVGIEPGPALVELERMVVARDDALEWRAPERQVADPLLVVGAGDRHPDVPPSPTSPDDPTGGRRAAAPGDPVDPADAGALAGAAPVLLGRDEPLARLHDLLVGLRSGRGGVVLVSGEAGIGKTRLVQAALAPAEQLGLRVGWGRVGDGDGAPAYWPWTQVLTGLLHDAPPEVAAAGGPALVHLLPELEGALGAPPDAADAASARFAVERSVAGVLAALASDGPAVVVLDDLQWADPSSLRLLAALADDLADLPTLVVATVRDEEARGNPALTDALALAARSGELHRIELRGLDVAAVGRHLAANGLPGDARLVEVVATRSGGNPFFLTELVQLLASEGTDRLAADAATRVPHGVRDVVLQRLARLPEASRELLVLAAVAGRSFDPTVLALAADVDVEAVLDRLEPAVLVGLVVVDEGTSFEPRFSHDLVRDAVYGDLTPLRRARLHRRVADALVERHPDPERAPAAQVARHFAAALTLGTGPAGQEWAARAARSATARAAPEEAAESWQLALTCHDAASPDDADGRFELLLPLATALRAAWDLDGARVALDAALEIAVAANDPVRIAEAAALYGSVNLWTWRQVGTVDERTVALLDHALELLADVGSDAVVRSRALGALGVELYYGPHHERAEAVTDESVRLAERAGSSAELARALNNAFIVRWREGRDDELLAITDRMLALPDLEPDIEAVGVMHRVMLLLAAARIDEVAAGQARAAELRQLVRKPEVAAQLDFTLSMWAAMRGQRGRAVELLERGWRSRYEASTMWGGEWVYLLASLSLGRHLPGVADRLAELAVLEPFDLVRPTAVLALLDEGRHDEARALVGEGRRSTDCWASAFDDVQWALIASELDLPFASELHARLLPRADQLVVAGSNLACWGSVHWVLARVEEHLGLDTARRWAAADAANAAVGLPPAPRRGEGVFPSYPGGADNRGAAPQATPPPATGPQ